MTDKLGFLKSVRFWKLALVATLVTMQANGIIDEGVFGAIVQVIEYTLGGSVVIRTVDRFAESV